MNKQISIIIHNRREIGGHGYLVPAGILLYYMHVTPYLLPGSAPWRSNGVSCRNRRRFLCGRRCGCCVYVRISKCENSGDDAGPPTGTMDREPSEEYFSQPLSEELRTRCGAYARLGRDDDINVATEHSVMFLYCTFPILNVPTYRARDPVSVTLDRFFQVSPISGRRSFTEQDLAKIPSIIRVSSGDPEVLECRIIWSPWATRPGTLADGSEKRGN